MVVDDASDGASIRDGVPSHHFLLPKFVAIGEDKSLVENGLQVVTRIEFGRTDLGLEAMQRWMVSVQRNGIVVVNHPIVHEGIYAAEDKGGEI